MSTTDGLRDAFPKLFDDKKTLSLRDERWEELCTAFKAHCGRDLKLLSEKKDLILDFWFDSATDFSEKLADGAYDSILFGPLGDVLKRCVDDVTALHYNRATVRARRSPRWSRAKKDA